MAALPEEVLCRIIKEVNSHVCIRTLSLVNRKFARIATPLLYSKIQASYGHRKQQQASRRLLDTLTTSPHLRSLCQDLDVGDWQIRRQCPRYSENAPISLVDLGNTIQQIPALVSFPLEWQQKFGADFLKSMPDAMLATILSLLSNLHGLTLRMNRFYGDEEDIYYEKMWCSPLDFKDTSTMRLIELSTTPSIQSFSLLSSLTSVLITNDGEDAFSGWDTNLISFFLRLPTLKKFSGYGCHDTAEGREDSSMWDCDDEASNVTSINLGMCAVGCGSISMMLRSCKALEEFRVSRVCKSCWSEEEGGESDYSYEWTHEALCLHRESLHTLRLQSQVCNHPNSRDEEPLETIIQLSRLRRLEIDDDAMFGKHAASTAPIAEFLPPDLQELTIYGDAEGCQQATFREVGRFLLSGTHVSTVRFESAYIADAEAILEELPDIAFEEISEREEGYCDFRMYRAEIRQSG